MEDESSTGNGKKKGKIFRRIKFTKLTVNDTHSPEVGPASGSQSVTNLALAPRQNPWGILPVQATSVRDTAPVAAPGQDPLPGQRERAPAPDPSDICEEKLARVKSELEEAKKALNQVPAAIEQRYWGDVQSSRRNGEVFQVGSVISMPWHVPDSDSLPDPGNARTLVNLGYWVYSVIRKFIVVEVHTDHCVAIPIFTYGGKGLIDKPKKSQNEHVGIRDDRDTQKNKNLTHCKVPNLIFKSSRKWANSTGFHFMSPYAYAHFTAPAVVRYLIPCHFEGRIKSVEDRKRIVDLYCKACLCAHGDEVQSRTDEPVKDEDEDNHTSGKDNQADPGPWSFYPVVPSAS